MAGLQTEYSFTLPKGYVDANGMLHRHGTMRMSTARDEIEPLRDSRINSADDPYLTILVLARVITELGTLPRVTPNDVEGLFAADLAFLQDLYGIINFGDPADVAALQAMVADDEPEAIAEPYVDDEPPAIVDEPPPAPKQAPVGNDEPAPSRPRGRNIEEVPSRSAS